jgi:predicted dehydrogenase
MNHSDDIKARTISRRDFIATGTLAGAGVLFPHGLRAGESAAGAPGGGSRKRIAHVGTGSRARFYREAIVGKHAPHVEYVGLCDNNPGRLKLFQGKVEAAMDVRVPTFDAAEFDRMIAETKPDTVIVTTVDSTHSQYITRAMELGCDVITEKPMTTDAAKCQEIIDTQKRTGRRCTVGFNYRYSPPRSQVKDLLMSGTIGEVLSVDFHWMLNTHHGADYFRRWHSQKKFSGGLMVHKATHHFDLVNWWLSAVPETVYANGKREFYIPEMAQRFGLSGPHERCRTCPEKDRCGFELNLEARQSLKELYLDNEHFDGYFRDRCVFRDGIDIEDTMNVVVRYDTNATLSYSLNAFNSWEGYYVIFNGTKGRIEHKAEEKIYINDGSGTVQGEVERGRAYTKVMPIRGRAREVEMWTGEGGHGGGDTLLLDDLFLPGKQPDRYLRAADQRSGAYSILTGVAANRSIATGEPVRVADLVSGIGPPDYPAMPGRDELLPMPGKGWLHEQADTGV